MAITKVTNSVLSSGSAADGYVLTADGSGNSAWEAAAGGGVDGIVSSADATAITIDSSENVGIGTASPATKLHVEGTAKFTDFVYGGAAGKLNINDDVAISAGKKLYIDGGSNTYLHQASADVMAFITDGSERMRIMSNGAIGMGFTSQISGGTLSVYSSADGGVVIGSSGGSNAFRKIYHNPANGILYFSSSGNAPYLSNAGSWVSASDIAIKKDIEDIDYGLETVKSLQPRRYKMKDTDEKQVGFVAQEIEQIVPEVVSGEDGKKGVSYGQITPLLVKAIQEQQTIIESLEARITALES